MKLEKKLILEIVRLYVSNPYSTISSISEYFKEIGLNISKDKVSKALHKAISENIVTNSTAHEIADKAARNSKFKSGYDQKARKKYAELFEERKRFIAKQEEEKKSKKEFVLNTFSSTFSDADEYPIDSSTEEEDLEEKYDNYRKGLH